MLQTILFIVLCIFALLIANKYNLIPYARDGDIVRLSETIAMPNAQSMVKHGAEFVAAKFALQSLG